MNFNYKCPETFHPNRMRVLVALATLLGLSGWGLAVLSPFMQNFVRSYDLKTVSERTHVVRDWKAVEQVFWAPSGNVMVHSVTPRFGGQATTGRFLKYSFASPRDNVTAIEMVKAFALDEEVDQLTPAALETCLEQARRLKAPQVKTMLWRKVGSELVKVYCGVSAVTEYVVFDARDLSSSYWRLRSTW